MITPTSHMHAMVDSMYYRLSHSVYLDEQLSTHNELCTTIMYYKNKMRSDLKMERVQEGKYESITIVYITKQTVVLINI